MAAGQTIQVWGAGSAILGASAAHPVAVQAAPNLFAYGFPSATEGWTVFQGYLGKQYGGNGVNLTLTWMCSATSGTVEWGGAFFRMNNGLYLPSAITWSTEITASVAAPGLAGQIAYTTLNFSSAQIAGIQVGELFLLRVRRIVSVAGNSPGQAGLISAQAVEG